jgi:hypothetical protein
MVSFRYPQTKKLHRVSSSDLEDQLHKDFFLGRYVKDTVCRPPLPHDLQELRQWIITAITAREEESHDYRLTNYFLINMKVYYSF